MPSVSFSEDIVEDETGRGTWASIIVCNGTGEVVFVELHPIETVRCDKASNKELGLGANAAPTAVAGGAHAKVSFSLLRHSSLGFTYTLFTL